MSTVKGKLSAIADNIRHYTESEEKLSLDDMAEKIEDVYEQGVTSGKKSQYDEFWDKFQRDGTLTDYSYAFCGNGWRKSNFKPKYQIKPTNATFMFSQNLTPLGPDERIDLREFDIDFSNCINFGAAFSYAYNIVAIGNVVNNRNHVQNNVFAYATNLHTIELYHIGIECSFNNTFQGCSALENITIGGTIANSIDFQYSPLTKASITSIVEHLSDIATGKTLTLKKTAKEAAFTDEEWRTLAGTKTNWTISLI